MLSVTLCSLQSRSLTTAWQESSCGRTISTPRSTPSPSPGFSIRSTILFSTSPLVSLSLWPSKGETILGKSIKSSYSIVCQGIMLSAVLTTSITALWCPTVSPTSPPTSSLSSSSALSSTFQNSSKLSL